MGVCCSKHRTPDEEGTYAPPSGSVPAPPTTEEPGLQLRVPKNSTLVESLVLEMLGQIATFVGNDEDSPESLVKLYFIADKENGWIQVVTSMVKVIPLDDPFGPSTITILFDSCPLPTKESVMRLIEILNLSAQRAQAAQLNVCLERNICVVLGCIAEKLAGPNSVGVMKPTTVDYLVAFLKSRRDARIVLFALIALENFAHTTENKLTIKDRLAREEENPLLVLEKLANSDDYQWRQVGFCAKFALDNLFLVEGRKLTYETVDMSAINVMLNSQDASEYLKIGADGLEARCDSFSFESVRSTLQVDEGCWYYEAVVITDGVMQIGFATKHSHFLNLEGYGVGDTIYSVSYDGCRQLVWHAACRSETLDAVPAWKPGDVLGCMLDVDRQEVVFALNGKRLPTFYKIFEDQRHGYYAAASFMAFQQCRFNFGSEPYRFPPTDRAFSSFNDHGDLSEEQKQVIPKRLHFEQMRSSSVKEDSCTLCFDETASCVLKPCGHRGFCSPCTSQLNECPMCRSMILDISREDI